MISRGETEGVFQLESAGMKQFMKELRPESIEDIIAGISLYRPGPMDQIPRYVANKNNPVSVSFKHPSLEPILDVTYGCMVYQEQVMEIVRKLGGYSLGRADLVRRAMSKKKEDVMIAERKNFIYGITREDGTIEVDGALRRGVDEKTANSIFDEMMDFASYAFNKSHAAAYAFVTYQTAYLKHFYPAQYMAALLSSVLGTPEKVMVYSNESARMGIRILPPDINESIAGFAVKDGDIRFGLAVIKNVGIGCVETIVAERTENGPYKSYRDFAKRVASLGVSKRVQEYLIKAGAFDALGEKRSCLLADFASIADSYSDDLKRNVAGQLSLWGDDSEESLFSEEGFASDMPEFSQRELLALEKESIGYYISGHPLNDYAEEIASLSNIRFSDFVTNADEEKDEPSAMTNPILHDGAQVQLCVLVSSVKTKITKNNKMMAFVTVEDLSGQGELIVFPNVFERCRQYLTEDVPLLVTGKLSFREDEEPKILCDVVTALTHGAQSLLKAEGKKAAADAYVQARREHIAADKVQSSSPSGKLFLKFSLGKDFLLDRAKAILTQHPGTIPVYIFIEESKSTYLASEQLFCDGKEDVLQSLYAVLGTENVVLKNEISKN